MLLGPRVDLTGKTYGNLTVDSLSQRKNERYYWLCICTCGQQKEIDGYRLRSNHVLHCGCKNSLIRKQFNDLVVISEKLPREGRHREWNCVCVCGDSCVARTADLKRGDKKHCGSEWCRRRTSNCWKGYGDIPGTYLSQIERNALTRELVYEVTPQEIWDLYIKQKGKCALSGLNIRFEDKSASLDRINSTKGYISNNIQWVHKDVNRMKWKHTPGYFLWICQQIAEHSSE